MAGLAYYTPGSFLVGGDNIGMEQVNNLLFQRK
jgi:hypothetical protein